MKRDSVAAPSVVALRYVAKVAEHGSFSAAARACDVSQPTVSNAIADLEQSLGARLFERSTKRVVLTPAGTTLLPLVSAVLDAMEALMRRTDALKSPSRKLLRIGFTSLLGAQRLHLLFEPFTRLHPDVEIVYKECTQNDMDARLEASAIDFICGTHVVRRRNRARQLLYTEDLRWVAPGGAGSRRDRVTLRDVAKSRLLLTMGTCGLRQATRELFERAELPIDEYAGQAISYAALEEWAELGLGGAILPASHIRRATSEPLVEAGKPIRLAYEVVWRKDLLVAAHTVDFVGYVRSVVPKLVRGGMRVK